MPDWFEAFLHEENSNAKGAKTPLAKKTPIPEIPARTDETRYLNAVNQLDNAHLFDQSEIISTVDQPQNNELPKLTKPISDELPKLTKPNSDELTKLTKPLREDQVAILEAAAAGRPPDVSDPQWRTALKGLEAFFAAGHGDQVEALGWPKAELYAVPKLWSQVAQTGNALLIGDSKVTSVTPDEIRIETAQGASQAFRRKTEPDYALVYSKELALRRCESASGAEEAVFRAREFTIRFYRDHHNASLADGARAIDAIIAKGKQP